MSGQYAGAHGSHGRDATPPTRGRDAGTIDISIQPAQRQVGKMEVRAVRYVDTWPTLPAIPSEDTCFAPAMADFIVSAKGGAGGQGGVGGSGGNGARGRRGSDATGHDGQPGGDGGNAGRGTDGAGKGLISLIGPDSNANFHLARRRQGWKCDNQNTGSRLLLPDGVSLRLS